MKDANPTPMYPTDSLLRRAVDTVLAGSALVVLSPVMLFISLAIVIESGLPVVYKQTRLGQGRRHFRILKFRKFREDKGTSEFPLTMNDDDRMTRVGRLLAATKLDEIPQFYNVLRGDMAIVGPRPESLALEDCFTEDHCDIFDYKPGIFGPSQVQFRSEADLFPRGCDPVTYYRNVIFPLKAEIDLSYYRQRTFVGDIIWIIRGILAVLGTRSVQRDGKLDTRITRHDDPRRGKSTA